VHFTAFCLGAVFSGHGVVNKNEAQSWVVSGLTSQSTHYGSFQRWYFYRSVDPNNGVKALKEDRLSCRQALISPGSLTSVVSEVTCTGKFLTLKVQFFNSCQQRIKNITTNARRKVTKARQTWDACDCRAHATGDCSSSWSSVCRATPGTWSSDPSHLSSHHQAPRWQTQPTSTYTPLQPCIQCHVYWLKTAKLLYVIHNS